MALIMRDEDDDEGGIEIDFMLANQHRGVWELN